MRRMNDDALSRLLDAGFDFACERRLDELVDVERLLVLIDAATTAPRLARWMERLVAPMRERLLKRARASSLPLGVWLPEPVRDGLAAWLERPAPIPRALVDKVMADEHVRESARAMLHETMANFVRKTTAPGGRGLRGVIGFGARAAGGLLGGLGDELQRHLEDRVRDFVDGGVAHIQQRVAHKLTSQETARLLGQRRRRIFLDLLKQPESEAARLADHAPWPMLDAMLPAVVTHNLARAEVREALRDELAAAVRELSTQTLGELLDEHDLREPLRHDLHQRGLPLARAFLASPHYARLASPSDSAPADAKEPIEPVIDVANGHSEAAEARAVVS